MHFRISFPPIIIKNNRIHFQAKIRMFNRCIKKSGTKAQRKQAKQGRKSDKVAEESTTLKPILIKKKSFFTFSKSKLTVTKRVSFETSVIMDISAPFTTSIVRV